MPVLPSNDSSYTVQQAINYARAFPELSPIFPVSGWSQEPAITIAWDVLCRVLAEPLNWKWNRAYVPPFLTVGLQQDYVTQVTDLGWLESCYVVDINNSTNAGHLAPKPMRQVEAVRDLMPTWRQGVTQQVSFIPNRLAIMGTWKANTEYPCSYGHAMMKTSPIQQFVDDNGNILFIDSTVLNLKMDADGVMNGAAITLPENSPYGVSGSEKPAAPPNSAAGTKVQDGTVVWTVADPNGFAIRVNPIAAVNGLAWLVCPVYQKKAPKIANTQQTISPIPDDLGHLFRDGFVALLHVHAGSKMAPMRMSMWQEALLVARRGADREQSDCYMVPATRIGVSLPIGTNAANPFDII